MGYIFRDSDEPTDSKTEKLYSLLFTTAIVILAGVGLLALVLLVHDEIGSGLRMPRQMAMGLLSAAIVCGGLIMLLIGIRSKKEAIKKSATKKESDEEPWLLREDWKVGRIVTSSGKAAMLLWIFVIFWCIVSAGISLVVVPPQLQQGNRAALIALIFPVIGLALFFFAWRTTSAWRRFRKSIFEMPAVPAALGGVLKGEIQVRGRTQPAHGWHLSLTCLRRTTTGPTNNLRTTEKLLWRDEKWLRSDLPQKSAGTTTIPVFFQLPNDKPESTPGKGDGTHWRLEAWGRLSGPDFSAAFEVPVFKLDEPQASRKPEPEKLSLSAAQELFGLGTQFSAEELKAAYRRKIREYHPDMVATLGKELRELAEAKSKHINEAYELLQRTCVFDPLGNHGIERIDHDTAAVATDTHSATTDYPFQKESEDPTVPYQVSLDEIRKQIHSRIQIKDLPDGKEFIFPSGRNPVFAAGALAMCVIWTVIVGLLVLKHAPPMLPLVFGAMDLLMLYFVCDLWFHRSHILISGGTVKITAGWLAFKQENSLKVSEAANFSAESGATVGNSAYYDLKLHTRDGKEWLLAKNLGHKPEADWLARQMTVAAKSAPVKQANE